MQTNTLEKAEQAWYIGIGISLSVIFFLMTVGYCADIISGKDFSDVQRLALSAISIPLFLLITPLVADIVNERPFRISNWLMVIGVETFIGWLMLLIYLF